MEDVSPQLFVDAVMGYQKTAAIKAAVALDLFTSSRRKTATSTASPSGCRPPSAG